MKFFILQKSQHICFRISFGVVFAWQALGQAISMNDMESSAASQFSRNPSCQSAVQKHKRKCFSPKEDLLL